MNARSLPPDSLLSILCREPVPQHRWVMRMLVDIRNRLRSGLRGNLMSTMIPYSTNTDKETYGASEGRKGGKWAISDACQRDVGNRLTFKASRRLKVFPQPWHALFWDFAECRAWCRLCPSRKGIIRQRSGRITSRTCSHVAERSPCYTLATRTCTDALPCATSGDLMQGLDVSHSSLGTKCVPGTSQIEPSSKRAATTRNRAEKVCLVPAPARAGGLSGRGCHLLSFDLKNGWEAAYCPRS